MCGLRRQFPEWLDLQRSVGSPTQDTSYRPRSCSWTNFHLRTIGASTLHTAAWNGDLGIVQFLLEEGQNPDTGDEAAVTPIMVAILRLTIMTMRCVIRGGEAIRRNILVDCREEEDEQQKQVVAVIGLLLQFGADVNARSQDGKVALHYATSNDAYEVAKFLLDAGASVDAQDENGKTPLHYCVQEGGLLVSELLLSRGATIDSEDKSGTTALVLVVQRANLNVLQLFMNHYQWDVTPQRQDFGGAVLLQAVDSQVEEVIRFIVDNDYAAVTVRNAKGETPMHLAILRQNPSIMELLADMDPEGTNLMATTVKLETPAHYAARFGSHREVHTLLQCLSSAFGDLQELPELGAENPLNLEDQRGMTSLYAVGTLVVMGESDTVQIDEPYGCLESHNTKMQLLVDHGAQLFAPGVLVQKLAAGNPLRLILPVELKSCLQAWLVDCTNGTIGDGTGYATEVLPLLLDLPLRNRDFPALLQDIENFARHGLSHALLLQLLEELLSAWNEVEMR
ncbi:hypothetical protein PRNP1_005087 [Phytophthora ramorum]